MLTQKIWNLSDYIKDIYLFLGFLIFSFISSFCFNTLFIKTDLSWLIYEYINALEINTTTVFNLVFASNTNLSRFFFGYLIIVQIFIPTAELAIPAGIQIKEAKWEIETHSVTVLAKISKFSV